MTSEQLQPERRVGHFDRPNLELREPEYRLTLVETPVVFVSLFVQLREFMRERRAGSASPSGWPETPVPVVEMRPWYRDLPDQIRVLFEKRPCAPLSPHPRDVRDIWQDYLPNPYSWANSLLIHLLALTALLLPLQLQRMLRPVRVPKPFHLTELALTLPQFAGPDKSMGGGGGGGDRSPTPASRGAIPKFSALPLAPPAAKIPNLQPVMPVQPSLLGPPELKLPEMNPNLPWGDPTGVLGLRSNGPGTDGGIGTGSHGGVGPGDGGGFGPGKKAGYGDDVFSVGAGVGPPVPIYKPEPAYSEEARKAKFQGMLTLWIVVDQHGNVADVRVAKQLGMGLDEKAVQAVRTWRFQPGLRNGLPVFVRVLVEVSFRLF